ncbi:MAG: hypothetical protein HQ521_09650 [Bacteroidetes bacterium]|nr:hypothetical protein [Bacteroidota bacterium]
MIIISIIISISIFFSDVQKNDQVIRYVIWSNNYKLLNSDFQNPDKPELKKRVWNFSEEAILRTGIVSIIKQTDFSIEVFVIPIVDREKSWKMDTLNCDGIHHEQLHFNITELYARKLRKELKQLIDNDVLDINPYENLVDSLKNELENQQFMYDYETITGHVKEKQGEWFTKIEEQLNEYAEFSTDSIDIPNEIITTLQKRK